LWIPEPYYLVKNTLRHFPFRGLWHFHEFVLSDNRNRIAVRVKANALARHVVHDDGIERLRGQFLARVLQGVLSFGGKANDQLRLLVTRDLAKDIGSRLKFQCPAAVLMTMVACGNSFKTACRISSADSTRVKSAASGGVNAVGPLTSNTRAPRRSAASANA
jgi:hypothetical protein